MSEYLLKPNEQTHHGRNGARYEIGAAIILGERRSVARRIHPDGRVDVICGFNGRFEDGLDALAWARIDGRYELAPEGTPITARTRVT